MKPIEVHKMWQKFGKTIFSIPLLLLRYGIVRFEVWYDQWSRLTGNLPSPRMFQFCHKLLNKHIALQVHLRASCYVLISVLTSTYCSDLMLMSQWQVPYHLLRSCGRCVDNEATNQPSNKQTNGGNSILIEIRYVLYTSYNFFLVYNTLAFRYIKCSFNHAYHSSVTQVTCILSPRWTIR